MLTKKQVLKSLQTLPNRFEAEQAIEQIVLLEKIRIGLEESEQGKVQTKEQVKKRLKKWLK
jgi:predicted transcriptional regulator